MKYHISPETGRPNICRAEKRACPIGDEAEHYANKDEARAAYENRMSKEAVPAGAKKSNSVEALKQAYDEAVRSRDEGRYERINEARAKLEAVLPPPPTPAEIMPKIATPAGFTRTEGVWGGYVWGNQPPKNLPQLTLEGDGIVIKINFGDDANGYMLADGHVTFTSSKGVRTFDRTGVDDSFYIDNPRKNYRLDDGTDGVNETIRDFIDRKVPESRARIDGSSSVPGTSFLATEDRKKELREKGHAMFHPAGFGTGYAFSTTRAPYAQEASQAQKDYFGVQDLWYTTFDAD